MSQPIKIAALLLLAGLPLVEIGLLIRMGQTLGFWRLALIIVLTAMVGVLVIRRVGLSVFNRVLSSERRESRGIEPLFDGFLQVVAGICLILPGPITDIAGLLLLLPIVRQQIITSGLLKLVHVYHYQAEVSRETLRKSPASDDFDNGAVTIEGEYERVSEKTVRPKNAIEPRKAGGNRR